MLRRPRWMPACRSGGWPRLPAAAFCFPQCGGGQCSAVGASDYIRTMVALPASTPQPGLPVAGVTRYVPDNTALVVDTPGLVAADVSSTCTTLLLPFAWAEVSTRVRVFADTEPVTEVLVPKQAEVRLKVRALPVMAPLVACCNVTVKAKDGVPVVLIRVTFHVPGSAGNVLVVVGVPTLVVGAVGVGFVTGVGASGLVPGG